MLMLGKEGKGGGGGEGEFIIRPGKNRKRSPWIWRSREFYPPGNSDGSTGTELRRQGFSSGTPVSSPPSSANRSRQ